VTLFVQLENGARTYKADAGSDALNYSRYAIEGHADSGASQDQDSCAEADQYVCPEPCRLVGFLPLQADHGAEQAGGNQPDKYMN
jgi:hypothetical protein